MTAPELTQASPSTRLRLAQGESRAESRGSARLGPRLVPYTIRRSRRARQLSLEVSPRTGLIAIMPLHATLWQLERFLRDQQRWILRHLSRCEALAAETPLRWPYGATLPYLGRECAVEVRLNPNEPPGVTWGSGGQFVISVRRSGLAVARRVVRAWYVEEARRWCEPRVARTAQAMGVTWNGLIIRDQRRRWGSCSRAGHLSLNFRLVMMPEPIADYVICHELAHRRHMNHGDRFWSFLGSHYPAYAEARAWLRRHGPHLDC